jgi:hypothetical protein
MTQSEIIQDKVQDVNLLLHLIKHHIIRKYKGVKVNFRKFLTLELTGWVVIFMLWAETTVSPVQEPEWVHGHCGCSGEKETSTPIIQQTALLPDWLSYLGHSLTAKFCAHNVAISRVHNYKFLIERLTMRCPAYNRAVSIISLCLQPSKDAHLYVVVSFTSNG